MLQGPFDRSAVRPHTAKPRYRDEKRVAAFSCGRGASAINGAINCIMAISIGWRSPRPSQRRPGSVAKEPGASHNFRRCISSRHYYIDTFFDASPLHSIGRGDAKPVRNYPSEVISAMSDRSMELLQFPNIWK
jgi:hypothetical protein